TNLVKTEPTVSPSPPEPTPEPAPIQTAQNKPQAIPAPRTDGKLIATVLGKRAGKTGPEARHPGLTYYYLDVRIGDLFIKRFLNQDFTEGDFLDAIKARIGWTYPIDCLITLEKKGEYDRIVTFHPAE